MKQIEKIQQKITTPEEILKKGMKGKMIFTNGCFDVLHKGHIHYLSAAAELGDYLVIGLNSDQSVQRLKGSGRPYLDQESRAYILAALSFVDFVVLFHEDTPYNLINTLRPDILVKGGDYKTEEIVGYDIVTSSGGQVIVIDIIEGYSSTKIINKLNS